MLKIFNYFKKYHCEILSKSEKSFFPSDLMTKISNTYEIQYLCKEQCPESVLLQRLHKEAENLDFIIILKDSNISLNSHLYKSVFIADLDMSDPHTSNAHISSQIANRIKQFNLVKMNCVYADDVELLRLPLENFRSGALLRLKQVMLTKETNFKEAFESCIATIRKQHRRPMKRSQDKKKYYVDDHALFFSLGKEIHAKHATGAPHQIICDLNARFRFGCAIDPVKHFNVAYEKSSVNLISCTLKNCHGELEIVKKRTHINVFSNDYIA